MAAQTKVFRLTSIASDLISLVISVSTANQRLIVLNVMPDEKDRSDQALVVSACSVLMLIYDELKGLPKNVDPITRQMYYTFDILLSCRFIWCSSRSNIFECNHIRYSGSSYDVCYHADRISRVTCDSFAPKRYWPDWPAESDILDTAEWQTLVAECNKEARTKLSSYKLRYFVRSYFFLALDCSIPVVESIDIVFLYMFKN